MSAPAVGSISNEGGSRAGKTDFRIGSEYIAILGVAVAILLAYWPSLALVAGTHNDDVFNRTPVVFTRDASWLFSVARPVAAIFANLPILPLVHTGDILWYRCFAVLSLIVGGAELLRCCVRSLQIRAAYALAVALTLVLAPGLSFATLYPSAWVPHIGSTLLAIFSYSVLCRSNNRTLSPYVYWQHRDIIAFARSAIAYASIRQVLIAGLIFQLALYNYPADALSICLFPAALVLFSAAPFFYRILISLRDIAFIATSLVVYFLSVKLVYMPLVRIAGPVTNAPSSDIAAAYQFALQKNLFGIFERLWRVVEIGAQLWLLPQFHGPLLLLAVLLSAAVVALWRGRILADKPKHILLGVGVVAVAYLMAAAPVVMSEGGYISYHTIVGATAITGAALLFGVRIVAGAVKRGSITADRTAALVSLGIVAILAVGGTAYQLYVTQILSRNEFSYVSQLVRGALQTQSTTLVILDKRDPLTATDVATAEDERGRALVPYLLGCLSTYCLPSKGIYVHALRDAGGDVSTLHIELFRGTSARRLSCQEFTPAAISPSSDEIVRMIAARGPVDCVDYSLIWHDLTYRPRNSTSGATAP